MVHLASIHLCDKSINILFDESLVSKISVNQDGRSNHGPEIDSCRQPGGDDLDPHGGRVGGVGGQVSAGL